MRVVFIKVTKCEDKVGLFGFIHLCLGNLKEKGMKSGGSISYSHSVYSVRVLSWATEGERAGAPQSPTLASIRAIIRLFSPLIFMLYIKEPSHL